MGNRRQIVIATGLASVRGERTRKREDVGEFVASLPSKFQLLAHAVNKERLAGLGESARKPAGCRDQALMMAPFSPRFIIEWSAVGSAVGSAAALLRAARACWLGQWAFAVVTSL